MSPRAEETAQRIGRDDDRRAGRPPGWPEGRTAGPVRALLRAGTLLFALVGALLVLGTLAGFALPRAHRLTCSAVYPQPAAAVWAAVADLAAYPAWVPRVERMERRAGPGGRVVWEETNVFGQVTYEEVERLPGRRLVLRMADEGVPYGGTWTYEVAPASGGGTRVSITEDAWVSNPFFRFLARFVIGLDEEEDLFLDALGDRLADGPTPRAASRHLVKHPLDGEESPGTDTDPPERGDRP